MLVRQWVDWKDSEVGRPLELGRLVQRHCVAWDQTEKIPVLVSPLDCSQAFVPQRGQVLMTDCPVVLRSLHLSHLVP